MLAISLFLIYIAMGRQPTKFPQEGVQKSDFQWTKDMTNKDRGVCKTFIDGILADVEKRDREILDLGNQLVEEHRSTMRKLSDLRDKKDFEIGVLKSKLGEMTALKLKSEGNKTIQKIVMIISLIVNFVLFILLFSNGVL